MTPFHDTVNSICSTDKNNNNNNNNNNNKSAASSCVRLITHSLHSPSSMLPQAAVRRRPPIGVLGPSTLRSGWPAGSNTSKYTLPEKMEMPDRASQPVRCGRGREGTTRSIKLWISCIRSAACHDEILSCEADTVRPQQATTPAAIKQRSSMATTNADWHVQPNKRHKHVWSPINHHPTP